MADEDDDGENDGFERSNHGEKDKGIPIKGRDAGNEAEVSDDPDNEKQQVKNKKLESAEAQGAPVGDAHDERAFF